MEKPPQPPATRRIFTFFPYQAIGIAVMLVFILVAVPGFLASDEETAFRSSPEFSLEVNYPNRLHYKTIAPFEVTITNASLSADSFEVMIGKAYLSHFSNVRFTPEPARIGEQFFIFNPGKLDPGETVVIAGELQSEEYGIFEGVVRAVAHGRTMEIALQTINLP